MLTNLIRSFGEVSEMPLPAVNKTITRVLASPSQVAHALDWKKISGAALLSVHMGDRSIDLATTSHPSQEDPVYRLSSIPLQYEIRENKKEVKKCVLEEISHIVQDMNVCGLVVSWPVQKQGWCGAACGRVLSALDQIVQETNIVSKSRSLCLWNGHHFHLPEDLWGRVSFYGVPEPDRRQIHIASKEQYGDCGMVAVDIAQDYIRHHWPELAHNLVEDFDDSVVGCSSGKPNTQLVDPGWLEAYSSVTKPMKSALA